MKKTNTKRTLFALFAGVVLLAATLAACTASSSPAELESPAAKNSGEVQRVTLEDSKAAFDSGEAVFLDVRSESSFASSHIPDALSIPLDELEARIDEIDPNLWVITYCT